MKKVTTFLWFDDQAEEAARLYTSVFPDSSLGAITRYSKESAAVSGRKEGSAMTVAFTLDGQELTALNGGPHFRFSEALSLVVNCRTQAEVDHYWSRLSEGGDPAAQQCGWLKDRFGVSWQVVPVELPALLSHPDPEKARRATAAMMQMKKLDVNELRRAAS
jgi:predicted 3-demethylubiquinone-9 3-methyltransferase (glyoxalase superfamily)